MQDTVYDKIYLDDIELNLASSILDLPIDKVKKLSVEEIYASLADSGYAVIRKYVKTRISDNYLENYAILPENISKEDSQLVEKMWKEMIFMGSMGYSNIFNRITYPYGKGYESIRKKPIVSTQDGATQILDIFLREKEGNLTEAEQEMIKKYRDFELTRLLTSDEDVKQLPINNDNSCVYIITPEDVIGVTLRNVRHLWQARDAFSNLYFEKYIETSRESLSKDEAEKYNSIIIELSTTSGVPIIPWLPRKINSFQFQELIKFCDELVRIKEETKIDFDETVFVDPKGNHYSSDIQAFKNMLEGNKDLLVEDSLETPKRTPFPTRTDITDEKLDSILQTKENLVADNVRNELKKGNLDSIRTGESLVLEAKQETIDK